MTPPPPPPARPGTIAVPGHGTVLVDPDVASLRFGVAIVRPTAADARAAAATAMDAVIAALVGGGVDRRDLRTTLVGLDAVRDYGSGGAPRVTGYQLTNRVEATVRSIDSVGALIDAALAAGATSMDGLEFRLADPAEALTEARRRAFADARSRAETLAAEAGVRLGDVVEIVEGRPFQPGWPRPLAAVALKSAADVATPVEAGTNEIVVELGVAFAIAGA
jgi:uncharacterized protein YggE